MPFTYLTLSVILGASLITGMPDMPRAQDATTWTPQLKRKAPTAEGPVIWTKADRRDGSRPVDVVPEPTAGVLFQENFNDQPDWTSTMYGTDSPKEVRRGDILPVGVYGGFYGTRWSPEQGDPDNHASLEILASNADKARGGEGKSAVFWRESSTTFANNFASDAQTVYVLDDDHEELYAEFWIRFSENWWHRNPNNQANFSSKMFRVGSWDRDENAGMYNGASGAVGPRMIWNYKQDGFGLRHEAGFYEGPTGGVASLSESPGSRNYTSHRVGQALDGSTSALPDKLNGGTLPTSEAAFHEQVFGPSSEWTKLGFYVKANSAAGVADGEYMAFIDDRRYIFRNNIPWNVANGENRRSLWNYVAIGGNDYFQPFPNEEKFEDWWAMDDLLVQNYLPGGLS